MSNSSLNDLEVPQDFEFETTQQTNLVISTVGDNGQPLNNVPIGVYNGPANLGGILIGSGSTNAMGDLTLELLLSTDQTLLYAYTPYGTIVRTQIIPNSSNQILFEWGTGEEIPDGSRRGLAPTFRCESGFYQVIQNSLKKLDVLSGTYTNIGNASSNYNGIGFNSEDSLIYGFKKSGASYLLWQIGTNGVENNLGTIANYPANNSYKGDFDLNGVLYAPYFVNDIWTLYTIDVDQSPLLAKSALLTALNQVSNAHDFAYNALQDKFYGMTQSSQLIELDHHDLTIDIIANYQSEIGNGTYGALWCDTNGNIYASENGSGKIYQIEIDSNGNPGSIHFIMQGQITNNNDGASCPLATSPFDDTDNDLVLDGIDAYPTDSTLAYNTYYPALNTYGSYAFEDLWPVQGDYDFNDLIIDFNYIFAKNPANQIVKLIMRFKIRAIGAGFQNSFGISFDNLSPSHIKSVTGTVSSTVNNSANGTENRQTSAVIIIFDDGHGLFNETPGKFINSGGQGFLTKEDQELTVEVNFATPITSIGTINPFIYTRGERGHEIHLINYPPTDLMDISLFNTNDDQSNPAMDQYYRGTNGLPWGLEFPGSFTYPLERTVILQAYPKFGNWVISSGSSDVDWYKSSNSLIDSVFIK